MSMASRLAEWRTFEDPLGSEQYPSEEEALCQLVFSAINNWLSDHGSDPDDVSNEVDAWVDRYAETHTS